MKDPLSEAVVILDIGGFVLPIEGHAACGDALVAAQLVRYACVPPA